MNEGALMSAVEKLLALRPEIPQDTADSLRGCIAAGEPELAFGAICSWVIELDLRIDRAYFDALSDVASDLGEPYIGEVRALQPYVE